MLLPQALRHKLLVFVITTAGVSFIPVLATPAGQIAVNALVNVAETRIDKRLHPTPDVIKNDIVPTKYDNGVVVHRGCVADQAKGDWWCRGPIRRGLRGVGVGIKHVFCFVFRR